MRRFIRFFAALVVVISAPSIALSLSGPAQELSEPGAEIIEIASTFQFSEGPAADSAGNLFFSDIQARKIYQLSVGGDLSIFRENSGGANGLYFDKNGNLLVCEGDNGRLVSIDPSGQVYVLADAYRGKRFNKPNDLWIDPKGGVYFSDPAYGTQAVQDGEHVYYLTPDKSQVIRVVDDMIRPNGLIGTADGKTLYITDWGAKKTFRYQVNNDGTLANKTFFAPVGSDGMTIDNQGNIYLTETGVLVYDPDGNKIQEILVEKQPTNVSFGGPDNATLFITARTALYAVRMSVHGLKW
jgi:gluconolactonase